METGSQSGVSFAVQGVSMLAVFINFGAVNIFHLLGTEFGGHVHRLYDHEVK
jgi:hypothetical protein